VATYRLSVKFIGRSGGQSATAAAAYRAGELIRDLRTGDVHDYRRRGEVLHTEILRPARVPDWATERESLWNAVEAAEKRKDSQVAREVQLSLPHELSLDANCELVHAFAREQFVDRGMIADVAIHGAHLHGDARNIHAHILLSTRLVTPDGFGKKATEWNAKDILAEWRRAWERHINTALARAHLKERVDHRSYVDRGIDREPEPKQGRKATQMERKGKHSYAAADRRAARHRNQVREAAENLRASLHSELLASENAAHETVPVFSDQPTLTIRAACDTEGTWRERVLSAEYGVSMRNSKLARYWRIRGVKSGLEFSNALGRVLDEGHRLVAAAGNAHEIAAMLEIARVKGWTELSIDGTREFKQQAMRAALIAGFKVNVPGRDARMLKKIELEVSRGARFRSIETGTRRSARRSISR